MTWTVQGAAVGWAIVADDGRVVADNVPQLDDALLMAAAPQLRALLGRALDSLAWLRPAEARTINDELARLCSTVALAERSSKAAA